MNLTIELPDEVVTALAAQAEAEGISPASYVCRVIEHTFASETEHEQDDRPFETGLGMFAKYGPAPSAEEIDANRAELFACFVSSPR